MQILKYSKIITVKDLEYQDAVSLTYVHNESDLTVNFRHGPRDEYTVTYFCCHQLYFNETCRACGVKDRCREERRGGGG